MGKAPDLTDYVDVAERIRDFREAHPMGTIQSECQFSEVDGKWWCVVKAFAYRTPDDPRPGTGLAWEPVPGKTPYTRDSELMNAETSAVGRALVHVGTGDAKRIASREEVRNRMDPATDNAEGRASLRQLCIDTSVSPDEMAREFGARFGHHPRVASNDDLLAFVALSRQGLTPADQFGLTPPDQPVEQPA